MITQYFYSIPVLQIKIIMIHICVPDVFLQKSNGVFGLPIFLNKITIHFSELFLTVFSLFIHSKFV